MTQSVTVRELIERLQQFDPDLPVAIRSDGPPEALRPSNLECCVRVQRLLPGLVLSDETQVNWDWAYEEDYDDAQDVLLIN